MDIGRGYLRAVDTSLRIGACMRLPPEVLLIPLTCGHHRRIMLAVLVLRRRRRRYYDRIHNRTALDRQPFLIQVLLAGRKQLLRQLVYSARSCPLFSFHGYHDYARPLPPEGKPRRQTMPNASAPVAMREPIAASAIPSPTGKTPSGRVAPAAQASGDVQGTGSGLA